MRSLNLFLISLFLVACTPIPATTPLPEDGQTHIPTDGTALPTDKVLPLPTAFPVPTFSVPTLLPLPYLPRSSDAKLIPGPVFLESVDITLEEGNPPKYVLYLQGSLPTPCHELRIQVQLPDAAANVYIEVYSVTDAQTICIQVLQPFSAQLPFLSGEGKYTFWVNGRKIE